MIMLLLWPNQKRQPALNTYNKIAEFDIGLAVAATWKLLSGGRFFEVTETLCLERSRNDICSAELQSSSPIDPMFSNLFQLLPIDLFPHPIKYSLKIVNSEQLILIEYDDKDPDILKWLENLRFALLLKPLFYPLKGPANPNAFPNIAGASDTMIERCARQSRNVSLQPEVMTTSDDRNIIFQKRCIPNAVRTSYWTRYFNESVSGIFKKGDNLYAVIGGLPYLIRNRAGMDSHRKRNQGRQGQTLCLHTEYAMQN